MVEATHCMLHYNTIHYMCYISHCMTSRWLTWHHITLQIVVHKLRHHTTRHEETKRQENTKQDNTTQCHANTMPWSNCNECIHTRSTPAYTLICVYYSIVLCMFGVSSIQLISMASPEARRRGSIPVPSAREKSTCFSYSSGPISWAQGLW